MTKNHINIKKMERLIEKIEDHININEKISLDSYENELNNDRNSEIKKQIHYDFLDELTLEQVNTILPICIENTVVRDIIILTLKKILECTEYKTDRENLNRLIKNMEDYKDIMGRFELRPNENVNIKKEICIHFIQQTTIYEINEILPIIINDIVARELILHQIKTIYTILLEKEEI